MDSTAFGGGSGRVWGGISLETRMGLLILNRETMNDRWFHDFVIQSIIILFAQ